MTQTGLVTSPMVNDRWASSTTWLSLLPLLFEEKKYISSYPVLKKWLWMMSDIVSFINELRIYIDSIRTRCAIFSTVEVSFLRIKAWKWLFFIPGSYHTPAFFWKKNLCLIHKFLIQKAIDMIKQGKFQNPNVNIKWERNKPIILTQLAIRWRKKLAQHVTKTSHSRDW